MEYLHKFPAGKPIQATHRELAEALNLSRNTIKRALELLENTGHIRIKSGKEQGEKNTYFLIPPVSLLLTLVYAETLTTLPKQTPIITKVYDKQKSIIEKQITYLSDNSGNIDVLSVQSNKECNDYMVLSYFKPSDYLSSSNTTTSNIIVKSDIYINQIMKIPAYRGKNAPKTTVLVTYEGLENIQGLTPFNFTPFDRLVFDAVCTINQTAKRANKPTIFTPEMVARAMHGKSDKEYMPPLTVSTIAKSLDKMMTMFIIIDATAHVKSKNVEINEFKYKGYLLPMESLHINAGGNIVDSYELLKTPFLFQYASMVGQIVNIENELLNIRKLTSDGRITDKYLQMNIDKQVLVRQLASRIDRIKRATNRSKKKQNNIILFETLFKESGIDTNGHPERLKNFLFSVLDYYTALEHIKSYNKRTAAGKKGYDGIEIII